MTEAATWPPGMSEMARRIRAFDWASTPLGAVENWSPILRGTVRTMLASPMISTLAVGRDMIFLFNDLAAPLYGSLADEALGRPLLDVFPEGGDLVRPFYERALDGDSVTIQEMPLDTRGEGVPTETFDAYLTPVHDEAGDVIAVLMFGFEIGQRRAAERQLRESDTRHRLLINSGAQAVWETDAEGVVVADSPSWRAYTGQTLREWLGYGWLDAIHPDDRAYAEHQWREAVAAKNLVDAEFRLRSPDGTYRWTNVRAAPVLDENGDIEKWAGMNIDIDARKRAEAALRESEERRELALEATQMGTFVWHVLKDRGEPDARMLALFDQPPHGGLSLREALATMIHPDDGARYAAAVAEASRPEGSRRLQSDIRVRRPDGSWRWLEIRARVSFGEDGQPLRMAGTALDITERKAAEIRQQESEEWQAFLLKLSDALRPLADAAAIQNTASRLLAEQFGASHAFYIDVEGDVGDERATASGQYTAPGTTPWPPQFRLADFGPALIDEYRAGRPVVSPDLGRDPRIEPAVRRNYRAVDAAATIGVPLVKGGRWVASFGFVIPEPREWTGWEVALVQEVAERTWAALERARAEAELRRSEGRLRALFESIDEGFSEMQVILDEAGHVVDWLHLALNGNFTRVTGIPDITGRLASEVFPNLEGEWFKRMDLAYRTGEPQHFETELAELGRWFDNYITRSGGDDDNRMFGVFADITERKLAERTLRESEERQAFLLKLSDALRAEEGVEAVGNRATALIAEYLRLDRVYLVTLTPGDETVIVTHEARRADLRPLKGAYRSSDFPSAIKELFERTIVYENVESDERLTDLDRSSFEGLDAVGFMAACIRRGGEDMIWAAGAVSTIPRAWTKTEVSLFEDAIERTWAAVERARAETALHESNAHQRLLLAELQHRVRNTLAVVRSIARRTADNSDTAENMLAHFEGRIDAFSRVQAALTRSPGGAVDLNSLIEGELVAHALREGKNIKLEGPDVSLDPRTAERMSLAIHELTTNAVKHGALINGSGRIRVHWSMLSTEGGEVLELDWTESGVDIPKGKARRDGFGMELLLRSLPYDLEAETAVHFKPNGLRFTMKVPLRAPA